MDNSTKRPPGRPRKPPKKPLATRIDPVLFERWREWADGMRTTEGETYTSEAAFIERALSEYMANHPAPPAPRIGKRTSRT